MLKPAGLGLAAIVVIAVSGALASRPRPAVSQAIYTKAVFLGRLCKAGESAGTPTYPAWVGKSFAQDNCKAPSIPDTVDGFTASRAQIVAGMAAAKRYFAFSEGFQKCVTEFVTAQTGRSNHPPNTSLFIIESHRILASHNNERKVAAQIRIAINAFNEYGSGCQG